MDRRTILTATAVLAFAASAFALTTASIAPESYVITAKPHAVLMTFADGADTRGFAWQTDDTVTESKVWLLEGERGAADSALFEREGRVFSGDCEDRTEGVVKILCHKVRIVGLVEGKTYSYRLGGGGHYAYGTFTVRGVTPDLNREVTILNLNDAQVRSADKLAVWENTVSNAAVLAGQPDLVLTGGDLFDVNWFYKRELGGQTKTDANWFVHPGYGNLRFGTQDDQYRYNYWKWALDIDTATPYLRGVPWALASGNHDCEGVVMQNDPRGRAYGNANGDIYYEHVTAVNWKSRCHSFDYGSVHVVVLPCLSRGDNAALYGDVATWVEADLKAAQVAGRTRWTVVEMHWGPYTTGDHGLNAGKDNGIAYRFAPIFSKYHVDLVMQAHDHTYSKTLPYKWNANGYYTTATPDQQVVNANPKTETIGGETYDVDPKGTYYVIPGCAGHRVGEDGTTYVGTTGGSSYMTRKYKVAVGKITRTSAYAKQGDDASQNPVASMFGVLRVKGDTLAYDVYAVATNGLSAPVLFDTLRVKKSLPRARAFSVTPYVQHPATNAMSVIWFTKEPGTAMVSWRRESGGETFTAVTDGVWAEALTNNQSTADAMVHGKQYRHRIRLTGLETGTRYRYVVELDGTAYTNSFRTAPGSDSPVRFIYYNDSETAPGNTYTSDWTDPATDKNRTYYVTKNTGYASNIVHMVRREPDLFVIAGDLAAQGGKQANWDEFWKHNAGGNGIGYNDPAGSIPILAAIGNHDLQDAEKARTPLVPLPTNCENPGGGESALERYLSYFEYEPNGVRYEIGDGETFVGNDKDRSQMFHRLDYGPVTFIFLDTNNGDDSDPERDTNTGLFRDPANKYGMPPGRSPDFNPGSKQYTWLTNNLADAQVKSKFTFVVNHHCPYSVGYHNRTNVVEGGEWLSARAVRVLGDALVKYGVDGWLCGHDEMVEHSRIGGYEVLPDGTRREKTLDIYDMGTAGDGLRGQQQTKEYNPREVWRAHKDCPEFWENGVLVDGGKHYGHMEVNVEKCADGRWRCTLTPVYIFVTKDKAGKVRGFDRRIYDDVVTLYEGEAEKSPGFLFILR